MSDFSCLQDQFWAQTVDGLTLGSIYALIALGYTLVYGVLRLINFAHSEIFMIGHLRHARSASRHGHRRRRPARPGSRSCSPSLGAARRQHGGLRHGAP